MAYIPGIGTDIGTLGDMQAHCQTRGLPGKDFCRMDDYWPGLELRLGLSIAGHLIAALAVDVDCAVDGRNLVHRAYQLGYGLAYVVLGRNSGGLHDFPLRIEGISHFAEFDYGFVGFVQAHERRYHMGVATAQNNKKAMRELVQSPAMACLLVYIALYAREAVERCDSLSLVH